MNPRRSRVRVRPNADQAQPIGPQARQRSGGITDQRPSDDPWYWGSQNQQRTVYIHMRALKTISEHGQGSPRAEVGGFLVGRTGHDTRGDFTIVDYAHPALQATGTSIELEFPPNAWIELHGVLDQDHSSRMCVGWYHTHPSLGLFLSNHDQFLHRHWFPNDEQVAVVADPTAGYAGIFVAQGGEAFSPAHPEATVKLIPPGSLGSAQDRGPAVSQPTVASALPAVANQEHSHHPSAHPQQPEDWRPAVASQEQSYHSRANSQESTVGHAAVANQSRSSSTRAHPEKSTPGYTAVANQSRFSNMSSRLILIVATGGILIGLLITALIALFPSGQGDDHHAKTVTLPTSSNTAPPSQDKPPVASTGLSICDTGTLMARLQGNPPQLIFTSAKDCKLDTFISILATRTPNNELFSGIVQGQVTRDGFPAPLPPEWNWCDGPYHLVVGDKKLPLLDTNISAPDQQHCRK
jgi:proteasome lid subunit RPN8/RPN11